MAIKVVKQKGKTKQIPWSSVRVGWVIGKPVIVAGNLSTDKGLGAIGSVSHLALAAFEAISLRCFLLSAFARAAPPFFPPSFPNATAAGFLPLSGSTGAGGSPVMPWTIRNAIWFGSGSFGFVLERFGIRDRIAR